MHLYARVCASLSEYVRQCAGICEYARVCASTCEYTARELSRYERVYQILRSICYILVNRRIPYIGCMLYSSECHGMCFLMAAINCGATSADSSILEHTRAYSSILEHTGAYSSVLEHTRAHSSGLERMREYSECSRPSRPRWILGA